MIAFVCTIAAILTAEAIAKIVVLASGVIPDRTPVTVGIDLVFIICLLCWAAAVLS